MIKAIILSFCFFTFVNAAQAADVHGVLRVVKGDVQIKAVKDGATTKARLGGKIFPKDTIITGKDARAKIVMTDNNEINVSPDSQLVLQSYVYEPEKGKKDVLLNVIYGKVRSKVEQKYDGKNSQFQVKTPSAVAGVRGTDFMTSFNNLTGTSQVVTFEGEVAFGQPGPGNTIVGQVSVQPGQMSMVSPGQPPAAPTALPKSQLAQIDNESKAEDRTPAQQQNQQAPADKKEEKKEEAKSENKDTAKSETKSDTKSDSQSEAKSEPKSDTKNAGTANSDKKESSNSGSGSGSGTNSSGSRTPTASTSTGSASATSGSTPKPPAPTAPTMPVARQPSSIPTGSMIGADDLPGGGRSGPSFNAPPSYQPPVPPVTQMPVCDFCNSVIQNGSQKALIKVQTN